MKYRHRAAIKSEQLETDLRHTTAAIAEVRRTAAAMIAASSGKAETEANSDSVSPAFHKTINNLDESEMPKTGHFMSHDVANQFRLFPRVSYDCRQVHATWARHEKPPLRHERFSVRTVALLMQHHWAAARPANRTRTSSCCLPARFAVRAGTTLPGLQSEV
jgi:hypothetical protein